MKENYLFEYQKIRGELTKILNNISNIDKYKYLKYLELLDNMAINNNMDYLKLIYNLLYIYNQLIYLDHTNILNYIEFNDYAFESKFKLVPFIKNDIHNDKTLRVIKSDIDDVSINIDKLSKEIKAGYLKCLAYFLGLSITLAIPVSSLINISNIPKEKLYRTSKEMKMVNGSNYEIKDYNLLYLNLDQIPKYSVSYEPLQRESEMIEIKEYNPWLFENLEAKRTIRSTLLPVSFTGTKFYQKDLQYLLDSYGTTDTEYKYISDIKYKDRYYEDKIYEVTMRIQDINDYILKDNKTKYIPLLITLISELLLYLCLVSFNNGPLIENIILIIKNLIKDKNIEKQQVKQLEELLDKYQNISPYYDDEIVKRRIRNNYR